MSHTFTLSVNPYKCIYSCLPFPSNSNNVLAGLMDTVRSAISSGLSSVGIIVCKSCPTGSDTVAWTVAGRDVPKLGGESE